METAIELIADEFNLAKVDDHVRRRTIAKQLVDIFQFPAWVYDKYIQRTRVIECELA